MNDAKETDTAPSFEPGGERRTGRMIAVLPDGMGAKEADGALDAVGARIVGAASDGMGTLSAGEGLLLETLGLVVLEDAYGTSAAGASEGGARLADRGVVLEPEEVKYALGPRGDDARYLAGYRDALNDMIERMEGGSAPSNLEGAGATWGLEAIQATRSSVTGQGVRLAVLDTGIDRSHPDVAAREAPVVAASFVAGESAHDGHGHGTHCAGTACGPRDGTASRPGYGVAPGADLYVGKVLSDRGSGADGGILAGIDWAVREGCDVISMSLGARVRRNGATFQKVYQQAGERARQKGCVIVAAAGNDGRDPDYVVSKPANCPSFLACGAVGADLDRAAFSNPSGGRFGGEVDIVGPGVGVFSAVPGGYDSFNGTSMATPHAAGVLALLAELYPDDRGADLTARLLEYTRRLGGTSTDVGLGLVMAPASTGAASRPR